MRKGLIFIGGKTGKYCANNMIAGTIISKKGVGDFIGLGMKRGTIITNKKLPFTSGFVECGGDVVNYLKLLDLSRKP